MNKFIISIDGPAGSGKQRIAKYIAKNYKLFHLDSGILYRRLARYFIKNNIDYKNIFLLKEFLKKQKQISIRNHHSLRSEKTSNISSKIAIYKEVRNFVNSQQKIIVKNKFKKYCGCVVDGRDIGSKVFKDSKIKLYIDVKPEIRAKRRHKQLIEQGEKSIYSRILEEINLRDKADTNRKESPLIIPRGAIVIDNSDNFKKTKKQINKALASFNKII